MMSFSLKISSSMRLAGVGYDVSCNAAAILMLNVPVAVDQLHQHLQGDSALDLQCPRAAPDPSADVMSYTDHQ